MKQILLIILLSVQVISLSAQEKAGTTFVLRFVPKNDTLYVPYKGNDTELQRLCSVLKENMELMQTGKMYISVSSYAASGSGDMSDRRISYLRSSRVKSELIRRADLKESYFVTDRYISEPYDGKSNVVVVVVPASVQKVAQIAGEQAAESVRAYYRDIEQAANKAKNEALALEEQKVREAAEKGQIDAQPQQKAETEQKHPQPEPTPLPPTAPTKPYTLSLRANLLSWAVVTPNLGVEWRINPHLGVMVNGLWTSLSWDNENRRYAMWKISPEVRYYIGKQQRGYLGAMYHIGEFNYKFDETGKQGNYQGGAITGGYQLPLNRSLSLDFHAGVGYTRADYDKYNLIEGVKVHQGRDTKNYFGVNQLGVTLVWKIIK